MSKLRVLHIVPRLTTGGAETMAVRLMRALDPSAFEVAAVSLFARAGSSLERALDQAGIPLHCLDKRPGLDIRIATRLNAVLTAFRPDVVHTHLTALAHAAPVLMWRRRLAVLHTVHTLAEKEASGGARTLHRAAFRLGVTPVAIARAVQDSMVRVYKTPRGLLIPNGVPVKQFRDAAGHRTAVRRELGLSDEALVFITAGRLTPEKNHALAIDAFNARRGGDVPCHLLIVGEGPLESSLRDRAAAGIRDRVHFLGLRDDVARLFGASDVFVLSSDYEGHPLTVMEAMAAGLPIISTAVGGVPEIVEDGVSGMLVPPGSVAALAAALDSMCGNPALRAAMAASAATASNRFDVAAMTAAYAEAYRLAVAAKSSRPITGRAPPLNDEPWPA